MMTIQYRLDDLLKLRNISARELSRRAKVSTSTISSIRRNEAELLSRSTLNRLCEALRCTPGDLIVYIPDAVLPPIYPAPAAGHIMAEDATPYTAE